MTHYQVQRETNPWVTVADNVPAGTTEYVDTDVTAGETYRYQCGRSTTRTRRVPWSVPIEGEVATLRPPSAAPCRCPPRPTAGPPEAPVLTASTPASADGRTRIDLNWQKPIENGSFITSYTLEAAESADGPWAAPEPAPYLGPNATSWSHAGLASGARWHYRMKAANGEGDSDWSDIISAATRAPGQAGPPINVAAAPDGDSAIDLSWDPPLDDGDSPITHYEVQWSTDGAGSWIDAGSTTDAETRTFKDTGIAFGTTRHYRVAAHNGVTLGEWSDPPVSTATPAGVPGQPGLTAWATASGAIELTWTVPADNGSAIIGYRVESSSDGNDPWTEVITTTGPGASYTDDGTDAAGPMFADGEWLYYRVAAVNSVGTGPFSEPRYPSGTPLAARYDANGNGMMDRSELIAAFNDYLDGVAGITRTELIRLVSLYLDG